MGVEGFVYSDKQKKKKRFKISPESLQSSHQAAPRLLLCKWGQPFCSQRLGSCSLNLVGETCEEQARSRSVKQFPQAKSFRTKHIDPLFCAEGKAPGSKKAA